MQLSAKHVIEHCASLNPPHPEGGCVPAEAGAEASPDEHIPPHPDTPPPPPFPTHPPTDHVQVSDQLKALEASSGVDGVALKALLEKAVGESSYVEEGGKRLPGFTYLSAADANKIVALRRKQVSRGAGHRTTCTRVMWDRCGCGCVQCVAPGWLGEVQCC